MKNRFTNLRSLFIAVAALELGYAVLGFMPPNQLEAITGWDLSADGQWIAKLLAVALLSQAWVAWVMRDEPHLGVATVLAFYQVASATADWVMWLVLSGDGVFASSRARAIVVAAIATHYLLGIVMLRAISAARTRPEPRVAAELTRV